jgi:hypothetical protein
LIPVEIKSGKTITSAYFKNIHFFQKIADISEAILAYDGDEHQRRSENMYATPWSYLPEFVRTI